MTNKRFYQDTFSQVHSSTEIRWEEFAMKRSTKKPMRRLAILAAVIAAVAVFSTAAVAADLFGLRRMLMPVEDSQVISLSGYQESPESMALAEWRTYLENDLEESDSEIPVEHPRFSLYQVYTPAMEEKLQEIAEKYGLTLHSQMVEEFQDPAAFADWKTCLGDNHRVLNARMYEDGTFCFDGEADLNGETLSYQMIRCVRGSFTDALLTVGDVENYTEWSYESASGQTVTLALSADQALMLADLGDSLVTLHVFGGATREQMEALADSLDLTVLTPVTVPDFLDGSSQSNDPLEERTALSTQEAQEFAKTLLELLEENDRAALAELLIYPCQVTTENGSFFVSSAQELLEQDDEVIASLTDSLQKALMTGEVIAQDGMVGIGSGAVWFARTGDGEIRIFTIQNADGLGIHPAASGITAGEP